MAAVCNSRTINLHMMMMMMMMMSCELTSVPFLVAWMSARSRVASLYQILCTYLHPVRRY